ncbi:uncharacterized protein I303_104982 [Kwoniella dejecticola CBS 10117]|uniref:Uncharacterized protein n=1 Tax=Kwoniella dejecticola CBS 10117 TaxID=1296121 RepID=A0A1A6A3S9_9TREE|nr:uncharacterized protein I303_05573 [Kwoniella dejecticola CBS 10117]OBR84714.1 hypothetical protein I303_05573 [Kwoniella dejecticola CBS 10117]
MSAANTPPQDGKIRESSGRTTLKKSVPSSATLNGSSTTRISERRHMKSTFNIRNGSESHRRMGPHIRRGLTSLTLLTIGMIQVSIPRKSTTPIETGMQFVLSYLDLRQAEVSGIYRTAHRRDLWI